MKCRKCNSKNTRVIVTEHQGNETWRYCRCLDCNTKYKTIETYAVKKRGSIPGKPQHVNCIKRGEEVGSSVLTEMNVKQIRQLALDNVKYDVIAHKFGIHKSTVYRIIKRKLWSHV
jgi:hypothetical protein